MLLFDTFKKFFSVIFSLSSYIDDFKFDNEQLAEVFMRPEDLQYSKKNFEVALKLFVYFMQRTETRLEIRNG